MRCNPYRRSLGFVPNSVLIMRRKPKLVHALAQLADVVWDTDSEVNRGFKRLLAHLTSKAGGCMYCSAHREGGALKKGKTGEYRADRCAGKHVARVVQSQH